MPFCHLPACGSYALDIPHPDPDPHPLCSCREPFSSRLHKNFEVCCHMSTQQQRFFFEEYWLMVNNKAARASFFSLFCPSTDIVHRYPLQLPPPPSKQWNKIHHVHNQKKRRKKEKIQSGLRWMVISVVNVCDPVPGNNVPSTYSLRTPLNQNKNSTHSSPQ